MGARSYVAFDCEVCARHGHAGSLQERIGRAVAVGRSLGLVREW